MNYKVTAMAVVAVLLTGCATSQKPTFNAKYYPQCYDPVAKLCKDQDNSSEVKGAVGGAFLGALAGALIGAATSKDGKGALIGAAAGAALGGLTGFFTQRLSKIKDREERLAAFQKVLGESSQGWDLEKASVESAFKCYREQINLLKTQVKNKQISKEDFLARMKEIQSGVNNINTYWSDAQSRMDSRLADGDQFLDLQAQEDAKQLRAAQQRKAQEQIMRQKKELAASRKNVATDKTKINNLSSELNADLMAMQSPEYMNGYFESLGRNVG